MTAQCDDDLLHLTRYLLHLFRVAEAIRELRVLDRRPVSVF